MIVIKDHSAILNNNKISSQTINTLSILHQHWDELDLSVRSCNCLKRMGIESIGELVIKTRYDLLKQQNLGRKSLAEIEEALVSINLTLGMQLPDWFGDVKQLAIEFEQNKNSEEVPENKIDQELFVKLLIKVEELGFSLRTSNCLNSSKIKYIGDLVQQREYDLLKIKNFGRKSLSEINKKLALIDLHLDMQIPIWTDSHIQESLITLKNEIETAKSYVSKKMIEIDTNRGLSALEDELFYLTQPLKNIRDKKMAMIYFGWDGAEPTTLQNVGDQFLVSRERVRQICSKVEKKWRAQSAVFPTLEETLNLIKDSIPVNTDIMESMITAKGHAKRNISIDGIIKAAHITGMKVAFKIVKISGKKIILSDNLLKTARQIISLAKKSVSHYGVGSIEDVSFKIKEEFAGCSCEKDFIISTVKMIKGINWLDEENEWFWLSSVPRNRLINQIQKILSVSKTIDISELRAGVARHHRMVGFSPPSRVLLELCRHISWCQVDGRSVSSSPPLKWREVLADVERTICTILMEHGPVKQREVLEEMCLNAGINRDTFYIHLSYSPIITKYGIGLYGLRGAKVYPGYLESLASPRKVYKVLEDFGWTSEGKIWLALKLSQSVIISGVFNVPAAIKEYLQGHYALKTADDNPIGEIVVRDSRAWSLGPFFRRRGGEPSDYVVIVFDMVSREAFIYIGDIYLLDDFRPS